MTYQTGTPASLTDLMDDLVAFAVANAGYVEQANYTASTFDYVALSKGGIYTGLSYKDASGGGYVLMNTSTAWAGSGLLTAQTGAAAKNAYAYIGLTPIEYWMFTDGDCVHCVVETSSSCYSHFSFGTLTKHGTYTGGEFVSGNYWNSASWESSSSCRHLDGYTTTAGNTYHNHIRCTYGGNTIAYLGHNGSTGYNNARNLWLAAGFYNGNSTDYELWRHQPNSFNGRAVLIPPEFFVAYDLASGTNPTGWIPLGRIENAAFLRIDNLNAEQVVNTDWMVFPWSMKNPTSPTLAIGEVNTENIGIAYKK